MKTLNNKELKDVNGGNLAVLGPVVMPLAVFVAAAELAKEQEEKKSETSDGDNG